MNKRYLPFLVVIIIFWITNIDNVKAQQSSSTSFAASFLDGLAYMYEDDYENAIIELKKCETLEPDNANLQYKIGICYLNIRGYRAKAQEYLELSTKNITNKYKDFDPKQKQAPTEAYYYLGIACRYNNKFDASLQAFKSLRDNLSENDAKDATYLAKIKYEEDVTNNAMLLIQNPITANIVNIGENINSPFADHSPVIDIYEKTLVFTSKRPRDANKTEQEDEDIFVSVQENGVWQTPVRLDNTINTKEFNEAAISLSIDGKKLYYFRSAYYKDGNIYYAESVGDSKWTGSKLLGHKVNSKYRETHAVLSPDEQSIYFTSARKINKKSNNTDLNIWVTNKLPNGEWSEPKALPSNINTIYDEETPFVHPDGVTLFFSSKGHNTMGGYDVFKCTINGDGTYSDPINIGYPINTAEDEVAYVCNLEGTRAYIASAKEDSFGDLDIYEIEQMGIYKSDFLVLKGKLNSVGGSNQMNASLQYRDSKTGKPIGVARNNKNGEFIIIANKNIEKVDVTIREDRHLTEEIVGIDVKPTGNDNIVNLPPINLKICEGVVIAGFVYNSADLSQQIISDLVDVIARYYDAKQRNDVLLIHIGALESRKDKKLDNARMKAIEKYLAINGVEESHIYVNKDLPDGILKVYDVRITDGVEEPQNVIAEAAEDNDNNKISDALYVSDIMFDFDRSIIKPSYDENLKAFANYLKDNLEVQIQIGGHTDTHGTVEYNIGLSYRRAIAVKDRLVKMGVAQSRIKLEKFGKASNIVVDVDNSGNYVPEKAQYNRRTEFKVLVPSKTHPIIIKNVLNQASDNTQIAINTDKKDSEIKVVDNQKTTTTIVKNKPQTPVVKDVDVNNYTIQLIAIKKPLDKSLLVDYPNIVETYSDDGWYRYTIGSYNSIEAAHEALKTIKPIGNAQAFIKKM